MADLVCTKGLSLKIFIIPHNYLLVIACSLIVFAYVGIRLLEKFLLFVEFVFK